MPGRRLTNSERVAYAPLISGVRRGAVRVLMGTMVGAAGACRCGWCGTPRWFTWNRAVSYAARDAENHYRVCPLEAQKGTK